MKNNKKETGITLMDKNNLPTAPNALDLLKQELAGLKAITETQYKTEGKVDGFNSCIQEESLIENLVRMHSAIFSRAKFYNESQKSLGISTLPLFKINNSTPEAFEHDIKLRIAVLQHADRKKVLEDLVKEGESFLTKEDQYKMYLDKVAKVTNK